MCVVALLVLLAVFFIVPYEHVIPESFPKVEIDIKDELIPPSQRTLKSK